jgi:hypothetical protein
MHIEVRWRARGTIHGPGPSTSAIATGVIFCVGQSSAMLTFARKSSRTNVWLVLRRTEETRMSQRGGTAAALVPSSLVKETVAMFDLIRPKRCPYIEC